MGQKEILAVVAGAVVGLVAVVHVVIGVFEMFLWTKPWVYKRLRPKVVVTQEEAEKVAPIVANAGLYNWFLAFGLLWTLLPVKRSLLLEEAVFPVRVFFLGCIMIAGVYGFITISRKTLVIQTAIAAVALVLAWLAWTSGSQHAQTPSATEMLIAPGRSQSLVEPGRP